MTIDEPQTLCILSCTSGVGSTSIHRTVSSLLVIKATDLYLYLFHFTFQENLNSSEGLEGLEHRFLLYNGGLGINQIEWLDKKLKTAQENSQKVIIFGKITDILVLVLNN